MQKENRRHLFGIRRKAAVMVGLIVIIISAFSFSLSLYLHVANDFVGHMDEDLYSGKMILEEIDPIILCNILEQGKEIYESIPEEIRKNRTSEEYLSYFDALKTPEYEEVREKLIHYCKFEDLKWLDLRIFDTENLRYIYIMDTDVKEDGRYAPGYWEGFYEVVSTFRDETAEEEAEEEKYWGPVNKLMDIMLIDLRHLERFSTITEIYHPKTGEFIGYLGTGEMFKDYSEDITSFWILHLIALVVFLLVVFLVSDFFINHWMVKPIVNLASAASDYAEEDDRTVGTHYFESVRVTTNDELKLLKDSMVNMELDISRYVQDISRMTAEKQRAAVEMELSARIQDSLLPKSLTDYTGEKSFDINALIDPAKDVGGDFYDYYAIDKDHVGMAVADVSGKGVPAALFMMVAMTLLHIAGEDSLSPAEIIKKVNTQLCDQNPEMMFVTVFFGIYTISERKLEYVNAGHEDIALYRKSEDAFSLVKEEHDMMMAVLPEAEFTQRSLVMEPGDKLFMYTDGVPEAQNTRDELFGDKRMIDALNELKELSGIEMLQGMREKVGNYSGEAPQFDDVTMLLLEVI